ncbi:PTS fructose transporter subunit IIABC [Curtanaerobium respiraculi]|uniref:PTS fructose transporter subunit IIABC n=1 Tax=Curtanaerobium respiraculi TaxID=2949669 RepID=UPI0024B36C22|nr:fructose-specific PTS transporter subunit EIIC [Curtanaerobium respiraculi]
MRITDLLSPQSIELGVKVASKAEAIEKLVSLHDAAGNLADVQKYREAILARESQGTTAIGEGMAIPHAKTDAVAHPALAAITVPGGVDYEAPDGKSSNLVFMIAAPPEGDVHLEVLARLMTMLMDLDFRQKLLGASDVQAFLDAIDEKEREKFGEEEAEDEVPAAAPAAASSAPDEGRIRVLGVTACPTGIAHTYMAAEALEQQGEKMGVSIKVETNGSGGAKNVLTADEIKACDGIIVAADKNVEMARFDGKPVYITKVANGINKPEELINKVIGGEAPIYHHSGSADAAAADESAEGESAGRQVYKHLMEGVSHMLPFVVAGGIFIALAFLIDTIAGAPQDSSFGTATPASAWFKAIGGVSFGFMLAILGGYIGQSIADRPGLLVGFVGGALAAAGNTFADPAATAGVSAGFLGALLAGFAGGYFMKWFEKLCENIPHSLEGMKPILLYPLVGLAFIGLFMCAVNPLMILINQGITDFLNGLGDAKILLGILLGGMMAIDMGGPINKAAYLFGTAAITTGNYDMMAAVMIGGMVPPLALALATTFFKDRWTEGELKSGPVNYIMGLSFITEGAIPYAAADPLRVIPSCVVGSALAGAISMASGCTLMAPHGGIFVFAVVGNWPMYLVALAAGAVAAALLLRILKKPAEK